MDEDFIWMIFCLVTAFVVSGYLHSAGLMCPGKERGPIIGRCHFTGTLYIGGKKKCKKSEKKLKKRVDRGKGCGIITKLSREGSTEKAKQGFGPGGLKKF